MTDAALPRSRRRTIVCTGNLSLAALLFTFQSRMHRPDPNPPEALANRAADQLAFIRDTMVRAGRFTAVSGVGVMGAGIVGTAAAVVSTHTASAYEWLAVWLSSAVIAVVFSLVLITRKAQRSGQSLRAGPGRTFALAFAPPLAAGALLTLALVRADAWALLPGTWLVCYGAAVVSGGAFSVRVVPVMGTVLVALGAVTLFVPDSAHRWMLGIGFGATQLVFGYIIARYHGG